MTPQDQWLLQKEKALAWLRVGFALVALVVIQVNPSRVARFPLLSYFSLGSFLLYSLAILYLTRLEKVDFKKIGLATTCLDLMWVSLIVFSTGAGRTPFFVYYLFPVIAASSRYGIKLGLGVAMVGVVLYGFIRLHLVWENPLSVDLFIVRSIYLIVMAYIFGFLSEVERKQNQRLLALSRTAGEVATIEERRRITRELHDGLLQSLATLILRIETCRKHLIHSPEELGRELQSVEDMTRNSMTEIRQFLAGKVTEVLTPGTIIETLKEELKFLRDGLGLRVVLESEPEDPVLPPEIEQQIYCVLREGLMNVARHSHASTAKIDLKQTNTEIRGSLRDDGVGFDVDSARSGTGFGLTTMKGRIRQSGGKLTIESAPGKGTVISFVLPIAAETGLNRLPADKARGLP